MKRLPFDYAVRNLGRTPFRTGLAVAGAGLVVFLVVGATGFVRGMRSALALSGSDDRVILVGTGSEESVERSQLGFDAASVAEASLGPAIRSRLGVPYVSPEVHLALGVSRDASAASHGRLTVVRGVTPRAFLVHEAVEIVAGRAPRTGQDELLIGARLADELAVDVGDALHLDGRAWTVVGRFAAPGTVMNAELWAPLSDLLVVGQRDTLSCVVLALDPARGELADVEALAAQRIDLELVAIPEREYYAGLDAFYAPVRALVLVTALLVGVGAVLGGLNLSYAVFSTRSAELGTLQTLGFSRGAILLSLVQESLLGHALGALLASGLAWALLDGLSVRFSMGAFGLVVDATVLATGLGAGLLLGLVGIAPPALRLLTTPIPQSFRA